MEIGILMGVSYGKPYQLHGTDKTPHRGWDQQQGHKLQCENSDLFLTFKRRGFKCPVLSADRNFLWGFKRLLLWLGKF
jgi:hypothetical protein